MKARLVSLLAALALCIWSLPATAFVGNTDPIGALNGGRWFDNCRAGDSLVGIDYVAGKDLDMATARCTTLRQGKSNDGTYPLITRGMNNDNGHGNVSGSMRCPEQMLVQAIHQTVSSVWLAHQFWLTCRNPFTGEHFDTGASNTNGGRGGTPGVMDCGDDAYAYGLLGRSDARIYGFGLMCAAFQTAPPVVNTPPPPPPPKPTPPPPPPKPKPDKPPLKVDNGAGGDGADNGNGFRDGGGNNGDASAGTDTTIYDEPDGNEIAYLSAGDAVTIAGCNDNNWCRISQPEKGWVWGDDLNR